MEQLDFQQGSDAWHEHRRTHYNASEAPSMMGCSPYTSRTQLMDEMVTGITPEVDDATQLRFDDGHRFEALARPLAENIIGRQLYPVTGIEGKLSASFDGLTADGEEAFEHKSLNAELRQCMEGEDKADRLPMFYRIQMEQQCAVSGCKRVLFMASKFNNDDELIEERHCWYYPDLELRERIIAGWEQLEADLKTHQPKVIAEMPKAEVTIDLPALFVHAKGEITTHNMDEFGAALTVRLTETRAISLVTDQDFSNAKEAAKMFRETAKKIAASKEAMLAQTETIGEAARKMDAWAKDLNATALQLEKDVEREDKAKKEAMVLKAAAEFHAHIEALEAETRPIQISVPKPDFAAAIKGKRNYASMQDGVDTAMASGKIAADAIAKDVRAKLAWCKTNAAGQSALFPDLQSLMQKPMEDFTLTITSRIEKQKADEAARLEAETARIRAEEEAKATAKAQAEAEAILAVERTKQAAEEAVAREAEAVEERRKDVQLAEQARTNIPASHLSVVELPSRHVRPTDKELIESVAQNFSVSFGKASDWILETAERMRDAA